LAYISSFGPSESSFGNILANFYQDISRVISFTNN